MVHESYFEQSDQSTGLMDRIKQQIDQAKKGAQQDQDNLQIAYNLLKKYEQEGAIGRKIMMHPKIAAALSAATGAGLALLVQHLLARKRKRTSEQTQ